MFRPNVLTLDRLILCLYSDTYRTFERLCKLFNCSEQDLIQVTKEAEPLFKIEGFNHFSMALTNAGEDRKKELLNNPDREQTRTIVRLLENIVTAELEANRKAEMISRLITQHTQSAKHADRTISNLSDKLKTADQWRINSNNLTETVTLQSQYISELEETRNKLQAELKKEKRNQQEQEEDLSTLKAEHKRELNEMKSDHEQELNILLRGLTSIIDACTAHVNLSLHTQETAKTARHIREIARQALKNHESNQIPF